MHTACGIWAPLSLPSGGTSESVHVTFPAQFTDILKSFLIRDAQEDMQGTRLKQ